jgi:hypothetical protein
MILQKALKYFPVNGEMLETVEYISIINKFADEHKNYCITASAPPTRENISGGTRL